MNRKHFDGESEAKERNRVENDKNKSCVCYVGGRVVVVVQPVSGQHDDVTLDLKKYSKRMGDMIATRN